jgi:uncharacterized protein
MTTGASSGRLDPDHPPAGFPLRFFLIAYAVSWTLWLFPLAAGQGWITWSWVASSQTALLMAGAFGPFIAAVALTAAGGDARAALRFLARALRWRIPMGRLAAAVLLCPLLAGLAVFILWRMGGPPLRGLPAASEWVELYLLLFFLGGSFQEEFGWAYAIDRMQGRWPALPAAALLGLVWGLWHLPLFFIPGLAQGYMPLWSFLVQTVALRIIAVWIYNGSGRSILATLLFHTSLNFSLNIFPLLRHEPHITQVAWLCFTAFMLLAAVPPALWLRQATRPRP